MCIQMDFFVVLFRKGPKFLLPLNLRSWGTEKIWISQTERKPKLIPLYVSKVSCREFWHTFLRNRSRWFQMASRFGPDLVQILRSRLSGPISATTHYWLFVNRFCQKMWFCCLDMQINLQNDHFFICRSYLWSQKMQMQVFVSVSQNNLFAHADAKKDAKISSLFAK